MQKGASIVLGNQNDDTYRRAPRMGNRICVPATAYDTQEPDIVTALVDLYSTHAVTSFGSSGGRERIARLAYVTHIPDVVVENIDRCGG